MEVVLVFVYTNLYEQVIHCNLYLSQGCILRKAHAKSSNHRWDNATFYPCFCHEISHTITNAHIREKQGFFSQIEQFSFDLAIEYLVDCYYPPGLRAFELSARAVQFFKTYTGKILRIWGNFRQKDFEEKNILCIFATNCNINK